MSEIENMYTLKEVSKILKLQPQTVRDYVSQGKIKSVKVINGTRVLESELKSLIKPNIKKNSK